MMMIRLEGLEGLEAPLVQQGPLLVWLGPQAWEWVHQRLVQKVDQAGLSLERPLQAREVEQAGMLPEGRL